MKALRVGDRPVSWREVEVHRAADGAPELVLRGAAAALASEAGLVAVRAQPDARADLRVGDRGGDRMTDSIREIIEAHGRLPVDVQSLPDDANLYQAGMTSHASVNLMLALEDRFDVEFPDEMLTRTAFESVGLDSRGADDARSRGRFVRPRAGVVPDSSFVASVERIAAEVAAPHADDVDQQARFPTEAVDALKEIGALSALVPTELGGGGASTEEIAGACFELGRRCGAAAMVFAMHQIQVACIVRHRDGSEWFDNYLRDLVSEQRLIASATSEVGTGGDMGRSVAFLATNDDGLCSFEKQAPTVSYGSHADDLFTTMRRSEDADGGDQVIVLTRKGQTELEQAGTWDPFGMRGTCSPGFVIRASFPAEQVLPQPFSAVSAQTMVPVSHIFWSHLWLGIATDAFDRARKFVRDSARQKPGQPIPAATRCRT